MGRNLWHTLWRIGVVLALAPTCVAAATVTGNYTAVATGAGPFTGNTYAGTFSYDDDALTGFEFEELTPFLGDVTVDLVFEGQPFDQTNDHEYDDFPTLSFFNGVLEWISYLLVDGSNGVDFNDPTVLSVEVCCGLTAAPGGGIPSMRS